MCSSCLYQNLIATFLQINTGRGGKDVLLMWGNMYTEQWNTLLGIWMKAVSLKHLPQTRDSTLGWNRTEVMTIFQHVIMCSYNFHFLDLVVNAALQLEERTEKKIRRKGKQNICLWNLLRYISWQIFILVAWVVQIRPDGGLFLLKRIEVWSCLWSFYALESCLYMEICNWWCFKWSLATYLVSIKWPLSVHVFCVALILSYSVVPSPKLGFG